MTIICNVSGSERKRLAQVLGKVTQREPEYTGAPTFAYTVGDFIIDTYGNISCPTSTTPETVASITTKLVEEGFDPEIGEIGGIDEDKPVAEDKFAKPKASAEAPAKTPDVAAEASPGDIPKEEVLEADVGPKTPDAAAPEEASSTKADDTKLTISIPKAMLTDDALGRLRTIVANKEELFKRALLTDKLPIEVTEDKVSFPWFTLTGISGEADAYAQFITAMCQMATEQKRVLDKPYDGDNDRFAMRIFMVRLGMKGDRFALARKLMIKHLSGNSGWRYGDSANKSGCSNPTRTFIQHLKKALPIGSRVTFIPMGDEVGTDIHIGDHGVVISVDDSGSLFIRLNDGSAFGISFSAESTENN